MTIRIAILSLLLAACGPTAPANVRPASTTPGAQCPLPAVPVHLDQDIITDCFGGRQYVLKNVDLVLNTAEGGFVGPTTDVRLSRFAGTITIHEVACGESATGTGTLIDIFATDIHYVAFNDLSVSPACVSGSSIDVRPENYRFADGAQDAHFHSADGYHALQVALANSLDQRLGGLVGTCPIALDSTAQGTRCATYAEIPVQR